jgi:hypothetical protein
MTQYAIFAAIAALFLLMAARAFRSGSKSDCILGIAQCLGVLALFSPLQYWALLLLLGTACGYLVSQIVTGARTISRLLPLAGAAAVVCALVQA